MHRDRWHWLMMLALLTAAAASWAAATETNSEVPRAASTAQGGQPHPCQREADGAHLDPGLTEAADLGAGRGVEYARPHHHQRGRGTTCSYFDLASTAEAQGLLLVGVLAPDVLTARAAKRWLPTLAPVTRTRSAASCTPPSPG